jgi:5S rRNA maturation endonuclease (ribonuclease M5)
MRQRPSIADKRRTSQKAQDQKGLCFRHSELSRNMNVYSLDADRADRIKEVLQAVYESNRHFPIIVEGKRDAEALRKLGFTGEIITVHSGRAIYEFCEQVAEKYDRIILLIDWDDKGEQLFSSLADELRGHWEEASPYRDIIKVLCQKDIKDVEGIPGMLERLSGTSVTIGEQQP